MTGDHPGLAEGIGPAAYEAIFAAGMAEGRKAEHLERSTFVQCPIPDCGAAIHIPLFALIEGKSGDQRIVAESDTTELWMHMETHRDG